MSIEELDLVALDETEETTGEGLMPCDWITCLFRITITI